jgi:hypothetical protein
MKLNFQDRLKKEKEKSSNIKFHQNPSSGRQDVPHGRTLLAILRTRLKMDVC